MSYGEEYLKAQKRAYEKEKRKPLVLEDTAASVLAAEKQGYLFHGSVKALDLLKVNLTPLDDRPVVFAGKPWMGVSFTGVWHDGILTQGTKDGIPYMQMKKGRIEEIYRKGGWLHAVAPTSFISTDQVTGFEFVSYLNVTPVAKVFIADPVAILRALGVVIIEKGDKNIVSRW